jgi:hypothetical protein
MTVAGATHNQQCTVPTVLLVLEVSPADIASRRCGFLEESVSIPRGIHVLSTSLCTDVYNRPSVLEELEDRSRMGLEQFDRVHSRSPFILESPDGHPHGTTPCEQAVPADSTESTAPNIAVVLFH